MDLIRELLRWADSAFLVYFGLINTSYLVLLVLAALEFGRHRRRVSFAGTDEMLRSPFTPPISVIVPAYNEGPGIVAAVQAITALEYPRFEVVVVDDGSTDETFALLRDQFELVEVPRVIPRDVPHLGAVRAVYVSAKNPDGLVVVRKDNGGKADALNVGINVAGHPMLCMVDADSILDPGALLIVAKPFADDPLRVAATGGVVRIANGCEVIGGRVVKVAMPRRWLPRIQVVEYLRAFLMGRAGWSRLGGLVVISGAFGLFRRDLVVEVGGMALDCIGEDAELVVRLHKHLRRRKEAYRIVFVSEPVSWSEAPTDLRGLGRQRRRWHRGLSEILMRHRTMVGNPRYGRVGLVALPWYVLFELLAPLVELLALVVLPLSLVLGVVDVGFAWRFILVAYGYAFFITLAALLLEEIAYHRYPHWRDVGLAVIAAFAENVGYRQYLSFWQLRGLLAALARTRAVWGGQSRQGFDPGPPVTVPPVTVPAGDAAPRDHSPVAGAG
ncbi:glycosyl transferase family 2 [Pilimelia anulata]|uniref:Glycosyl transferase family 2 n=1 Tax=Pilimelia anulata TaxID=53371 RepID=A0A8J3B318_9ACTN|nr:glycosyltransferase [Pilimelia anulata]GGJ77867.1 glycosyl transferase family 2 [Pilimelia anulata]